MAVKIQFRRDTAANWQSVNPILSQGELGLDTTNNRFKMGNGSTAWNDLAYTVDFEPDGTYPDLRAQATTAEDVGLGNVTNESKTTMFTDPTFTGTVSGVTATMVGLGNVTNESKSTMFNDPTFTGIVTGVSKEHVGLGNVTNDAQAKAADLGQPNGIATLNGDGKVPATQLPSYVDDVVEAANLGALANTGETGKIYVTLDDNKTYRWTGSAYVEISASLVPNDGTLTLATSGIASGDQTFTADQSTNATFTVNVPGTDLGSSGTGGTRTITSSTGNDTTITYNASDVGAATTQFYTTTIATGDWSGTDPVTAVKTVSGVLSTDKPLIDIDLSAVAFADVEDKQTEYAKIYRVAATDDDEITFYALEAPTEELVINIKVVR
jgi:hypothetical protein